MTRDDQPGPWRVPDELASKARMAKRRLPDGELVDDFLTIEEAAWVLQIPVELAIKWADEDLIERVDIDGEEFIDTFSVARFRCTGSRTFVAYMRERTWQMELEARRHPLGREAGWRALVFPDGVSDALWKGHCWNPERAQLRTWDGDGQPVPTHPALTKALQRAADVGHLPYGDDFHPMTEQDFEAAWADMSDTPLPGEDDR